MPDVHRGVSHLVERSRCGDVSRDAPASHQQGYGHTADVADRPFNFEQSADDTAALLQYLHVDQADVLGFSSGGTIALQVAIRHPRMVRKLVIASGFLSRDGGYPAFWNGFAHARLQVPRCQKPNNKWVDKHRSLRTCDV